MALYLLLVHQMPALPPRSRRMTLLSLCCPLLLGSAAQAQVRTLSSGASPYPPGSSTRPGAAQPAPLQLEHVASRSVPGSERAPVELPEAAFVPQPELLPAVGAAEPHSRPAHAAGARLWQLDSLDLSCRRPGLSGLFLEPHPLRRAVHGSAAPTHPPAFSFHALPALARELSPLLLAVVAVLVFAGLLLSDPVHAAPVLLLPLRVPRSAFLESHLCEALLGVPALPALPPRAESDPPFWPAVSHAALLLLESPVARLIAQVLLFRPHSLLEDPRGPESRLSLAAQPRSLHSGALHFALARAAEGKCSAPALSVAVLETAVCAEPNVAPAVPPQLDQT